MAALSKTTIATRSCVLSSFFFFFFLVGKLRQIAEAVTDRIGKAVCLILCGIGHVSYNHHLALYKDK